MRNLLRLLVCSLVCSAALLSQTVLHVDPTSIFSGDGSAGSPVRSWDEAVSSLGGDSDFEILVKRGTTSSASKTLKIRRNVRVAAYGSGAAPVLDGGYAWNVAKLRNPLNVEVSDISVTKITDGWHSNGHAENVVFRRCAVSLLIGGGAAGFWHESVSNDEATGFIRYEDCSVYQSDSDGFSSHGYAYALLERCTADFVGGLWAKPAEAPPTPFASRTLYVDPVGGSDSNDGLSAEKPLLTATGLNAKLAVGDSVLLLRGTTLTTGLPIAAKASCRFAAYGTGLRPTLKPSSTAVDAVTVASATNVRFDDLRIEAADEAFALSGQVDGFLLNGLLVEGCAHAVESDSTAAGWLFVYATTVESCSQFGMKLDGSVTLRQSGGTYLNNATNASGAAVTTIGSAKVQILDVKFDGNGPDGLELTANTGANLVDRCWFTRTAHASATDLAGIRFAPTSAASASDPTLLVKNSLICTPNPAASTNPKGIYSTQRVDVFNCSFWNENAGTNTRSTYEVWAAGGVLTLRNCAFQHSGTYANIYYVRGDASFANVVATNNFYFDSGAAPSRWHDGSARSFATFTTSAPITDETTGGYTTSTMYRTSITSVSIADRLPSNYWQEASAPGPILAGSVASNGGVDLTAAIAALGWSETGDFGQRPHGLDGSWSSGFCELINWSPDGFTNHAYAHWQMHNCSARWCEDGFHTIHQAPMVDMSYNALYDCVFEYCYQNGVVSISFVTSGTVDMYRCRIAYCGEFGADLYPPSGSTEIADGCVFVGNRINYRSSGAGIAQLRNCLFVATEKTTLAEVYCALKDSYVISPTVDTLQVYNCSFLLPVLTTEASPYYAIRNATGGTGTVTAINNLFVSTDVSNTYFFRLSASGQLGEADNNFYWQVATAGNRSKWHISSAQSFATWQGYNKGTAAAATDGNGSVATTPFCPVIATIRSDVPSVYEMSVGQRNTVAGTKGKNLSATFRSDASGGLRGGSGAVWPPGPSDYAYGSAGVFRTGARLVLSKVTLDGLQNVPLRINDRPLAKGERVRIESVRLSYDGASPTSYAISEGRPSEDAPLVSGALGSAVTPITGPFLGAPGKSLWIAFAANSGGIHGDLVWSIESSDPAVTPANPPRRASVAR